MPFDPFSRLRKRNLRQQSDVAQKLIAMCLHEISASLVRADPQLRVETPEYESAVRQLIGVNCAFCDEPLTEAVHVEHLDAMNRVRAGLHIAGNVVLSCKRCNMAKRNDDQGRGALPGSDGWRNFLSHIGAACPVSCTTCKYWRELIPDDARRHHMLKERCGRIEALRAQFRVPALRAASIDMVAELEQLYRQWQHNAKQDTKAFVDKHASNILSTLAGARRSTTAGPDFELGAQSPDQNARSTVSDRGHADSDTQGRATTPLRGSKRHLLEWIDRPGFLGELNGLLDPVPVHVEDGARYMPRGTRSPREARLESFGRDALPHPTAWSELQKWWLVHSKGANTPNWDFASQCRINNTGGLLLMEAKANVEELRAAGKSIAFRANGARRSDESIRRSRENHARIAEAIREASSGLTALEVTYSFDLDSHYQLANRLAFVWKLASKGIPSVLVYLGFWGDDGLRLQQTPFADSQHWKDTFASHAASILPNKSADVHFTLGETTSYLLVRARKVLSHSPPSHSHSRMRPTSRGRPDLHAGAAPPEARQR